MDLKQVSCADFESQLGQPFRAKSNGHDELVLILSKCEELHQTGHEEVGHLRQPFRLLFTTEDERQLGQGLFEIENETVGHAALFLVPISNGKYEAIFN